MLAEFQHLLRWEKNVAGLGHGTSSALSAEEALGIARNADPMTPSGVADNDPQGLTVGMKVSVGPDVESGLFQLNTPLMKWALSVCIFHEPGTGLIFRKQNEHFF